jgi:hypothetical protein
LPSFADLEDGNMQQCSSISGPLKSTYVQPLVDVQNSAEIFTNYYVQYKFPLDNFHLQDPSTVTESRAMPKNLDVQLTQPTW